MKQRIATRRRVLQIALACAAVAWGGCGGDSDRFEMSGNVTFRGAPVPYGYIRFEPDGTQENHKPGSGAPIRDGRYETTEGKGIYSGPYIVRISGSDGVPVEIPGEGMDPAGTALFEEYVAEVTFEADQSTHDFQIPDVGQQ